jgi:hypothetical protein
MTLKEKIKTLKTDKHLEVEKKISSIRDTLLEYDWKKFESSDILKVKPNSVCISHRGWRRIVKKAYYESGFQLETCPNSYIIDQLMFRKVILNYKRDNFFRLGHVEIFLDGPKTLFKKC